MHNVLDYDNAFYVHEQRKRNDVHLLLLVPNVSKCWTFFLTFLYSGEYSTLSVGWFIGLHACTSRITQRSCGRILIGFHGRSTLIDQKDLQPRTRNSRFWALRGSNFRPLAIAILFELQRAMKFGHGLGLEAPRGQKWKSWFWSWIMKSWSWTFFLGLGLE